VRSPRKCWFWLTDQQKAALFWKDLKLWLTKDTVTCFAHILITCNRVTIFWWPKTRTLGPANTWANSNYTRSLLNLINFNTFKVGYASSVWIENCYIVIWKQDMSWENRIDSHPNATFIQKVFPNIVNVSTNSLIFDTY